MSNSFISYQKKRSIEYASICTPQRVNGKKVNNPVYLGRVIDKDRGIFKNQKRGIFRYTLAEGFSNVDISTPEIQQHIASSSCAIQEKLILDFGSSFVFFETLKSTPFYDIFRKILPKDADTLLSFLCYKVTQQTPNCVAADWWSGDFARVLFPKAKLESQRISEFLKRLGEELVQRGFFEEYIKTIRSYSSGHIGERLGEHLVKSGNNSRKTPGILIDSTGLPNAIDFPLAAVHTHGGETNRETRLILVVDRSTNLPLFFRYNAGNIVDVSTLKSTINELSAIGVKTECAIVDAGYFSEDNVKDLYSRDIAFVTRLGSNRRLYKELLAAHIAETARAKYLLKINERIVHVKKVPVDLYGNAGFVYIAIDAQRRADETKAYLMDALEDKVATEEIEEELEKKGVFMLISSEDVEPEEILPLYYTRQVVEQIFDLNKNNVDLLPLRVHSEETFRGHLMLTFLASVAFLVLRDRLKTAKINTTEAFARMSVVKCKVYENEILVKEPTKKAKKVAETLGVRLPERIRLACGAVGSGQNTPREL
jgi:hypothetical protein